MQSDHPDSPSSPEDPPKRTALQTLWKHARADLARRLGDAEYERWFSPVKLVRMEAEALWFSAPNTIYSLWIEENYLGELAEAIASQLPGHPPIRFEVAAADADPGEAAGAASSPGSLETSGPSGEPPRCPAPVPGAPRPASSAEGKDDQRKWKAAAHAASLRDGFLFENFVVGPANRLANAAARGVAEKPGRTYHPLFIHSGSGLGKTHLLHAIGWDALRRRPRSRVVYLSAEKFANQYIEAIQKNDLTGFRKRYREADLLLIDDIQFLSGKEGMQEEFFHTFNSLTDRHKQIVLASDRPATEIRELEERLVTRFQWGMTAEIMAPGLETRIAILRRKRAERGADVPDWAIDQIASQVTANVRAMEGALIRAATLASINDGEQALDEDSLNELLVGFTDAENARQVSVQAIQELVAEHYDVSVREINGRSRTSRLVEARHVAMALAREKTDLSLAEIAREFGGRDHGTVINAVRKIAQKAEASPGIRRNLDFLRRALGSAAASAGKGRRAKQGGGR